MWDCGYHGCQCQYRQSRKLQLNDVSWYHIMQCRSFEESPHLAHPVTGKVDPRYTTLCLWHATVGTRRECRHWEHIPQNIYIKILQHSRKFVPTHKITNSRSRSQAVYLMAQGFLGTACKEMRNDFVIRRDTQYCKNQQLPESQEFRFSRRTWSSCSCLLTWILYQITASSPTEVDFLKK